MVREIRRKGALVIRLHVSGDFYDAEYADKWLHVFRACPAARFYFYTRSWRVAEIEPVLVHMADEANARVWYSVDRESGLPEWIPDGVRLAWLQDDATLCEDADLVFRVRALRQDRVRLPLLCPQETPQGKLLVNCGNCGTCRQ